MAQDAGETILDEARELLVQGKRFMALEDFQAATDSLEQCCQLFDAFYGVGKRECADAYLEYGLALVALANQEAGSGTDKIMKKAGIEGNQEDEEDEEEDDEEEEDGDDEEGDDEEQDDEENKEDADKQTNGDHVPMEADQISKDVAENGVDQEKDNNKTNGVEESGQPQTSSSAQNEEPTPGTSSGQAGAGGDDDEPVENEEATSIEIAWEVLCLAKRVFMTDESMEGRLKLAETLQKLGEISIEWDNNDNAVSILEECLKIRSLILPPEDRLIALTYYHLGLAHSFKSETQNANENFQNAINVIEKRIATLSKDLEKAKEAQDTVAISTYQKEISDLKELLPDMTMRLDDSKEDSVKSTEVMKRTREEMQLEDEEAKKLLSDKSKPVEDISHLVKRKAT